MGTNKLFLSRRFQLLINRILVHDVFYYYDMVFTPLNLDKNRPNNYINTSKKLTLTEKYTFVIGPFPYLLLHDPNN